MSDISELMQRRERLLGPNVPTFYETPLHIVRGKGVWLWDADGRRYLDCYNNVPHVGHCHPKVVEAIAQQSAQLNTHTRYLHEGILDYIEALTAHFGPNITSAIMTCTGSEANDVALRMAQAATGKTGIECKRAHPDGRTCIHNRIARLRLNRLTGLIGKPCRKRGLRRLLERRHDSRLALDQAIQRIFNRVSRANSADVLVQQAIVKIIE